MPVDGEIFHVNRTDDLSILCSARGIPPPSIRFLREDVELSRTGGESGSGIDLASRVELGNVSSPVLMDDGTFMVLRMLAIYNVAEDETGNFTCKAFSTIPELGLSLSDSRIFWLLLPSKLKPRSINFVCVCHRYYTAIVRKRHLYF